MKARLIVVMIFALSTSIGYAWSMRTAEAGAEPQQQRRGRRIGSARPTASARDFSRFSHRSAKHAGLACSECHKVPSGDWVKAGGFPDVTDYPGHSACVKCHRTEFFRGARPVICTVCHTKVSPRGEARFSFAKPDAASQFTTVFPHDRHQDVIAALRTVRDLNLAHAAQQNGAQKYNNCTICHLTDERALVPATGEGFTPPAGTFKTEPTGHASCFTCHYQNQKPTRMECAGCHQVSPQDVLRPPVPPRVSLKFTHLNQDHVMECTACHINITAASSVRGVKPDVPISSCAGCHKTSTSRTTATVETELEARDRSATFVCTKCHTPAIGGQKVPSGHRALFK